MNSKDAPRGQIPVLGEAWLPVGEKAFVAAAWLAPLELVRPLVPPELAIVALLPGRTLATAFLGDYGPESTLAYHELGLNPALVRLGGGLPAAWNDTLVVDSEAARIGGELVGVHKQLLPFAWSEAEERGRAVGSCTVGSIDAPLVHIEYREGHLPVPVLPMPAATIRGQLLLRSFQRIRGERQRLARVRFHVPPDSALGWLAALGDPLVGVVVKGMRGRMMDGVRVERILPDRGIRPPMPREDAPPDRV